MKSLLVLMILTIGTGLLLFGCSSSSEPEEHHEEFSFSLSTDPATITAGNDTVEIVVVVENQNGNHMGGLTMTGEMHLPNEAGEVEIEFHEDASEEGHYHADYVFTVSGMYELHSGFMHDNEEVEKVFIITVL